MRFFRKKLRTSNNCIYILVLLESVSISINYTDKLYYYIVSKENHWKHIDRQKEDTYDGEEIEFQRFWEVGKDKKKQIKVYIFVKTKY